MIEKDRLHKVVSGNYNPEWLSLAHQFPGNPFA
jgi:hypothetical protein